jgi:hypothetical protein
MHIHPTHSGEPAGLPDNAKSASRLRHWRKYVIGAALAAGVVTVGASSAFAEGDPFAGDSFESGADTAPVELAPADQASLDTPFLDAADQADMAPVDEAPAVEPSLDDVDQVDMAPVDEAPAVEPSLDDVDQADMAPVDEAPAVEPSLDDVDQADMAPVDEVPVDQASLDTPFLDAAYAADIAPTDAVDTFNVTQSKDGRGVTGTYRRTDGDSQLEVTGGLRNNSAGGVEPSGSLQFDDGTATLKVNSDGTLSVATPITDVLGEGDTLTPKATYGPTGVSVGADYRNGPFRAGVTTDGQETKGTVGFDTGTPAPRDPSQFTPSDDIDQATEEFIENRDNPTPDESDEPVPGYSRDGSQPATAPEAGETTSLDDALASEPDVGLAPGDGEEILLASNDQGGVVSDTPEAGLIAKLPKPERNCQGNSGSISNSRDSSTVYTPCQVDNITDIEERDQKLLGFGCVAGGVVVGILTKNPNTGVGTTTACGGIVADTVRQTDDLKRISRGCKAQDQYTRVNEVAGKRSAECTESPTPYIRPSNSPTGY